jgi:predicted DNA-binding protein (MmcQ/YjbR family)
LPAVTEDVKWGHDLCFSIGNKMFLVIGLDNSPTTSSFKVTDEEFEEMSSRDGFIPAPYLARYKWVHTDNINRLTKKEWQYYIKQSYELIKSKLPKKIIKQSGIE